MVFDFGGVLLDWNPRHLYRKLFPHDAEAMERFLLEIGFTDWNVELDRGRPFAVAVAELSRLFPHHADLIRAYHERWDETVAGPIPATVEIVAALKQAGVPLYGLSNWSAETFRRVRPRYTFLDWFDVIVISGELGLVKPDPRIFTTLLARTGRAAGECLFVDDGEDNVVAARALGFDAIRFESPEQLRKELCARGVLKA
jgi:2-haloacid dehalogenase